MVLGDFLARRSPPSGDARPDRLDQGIRTARMLAQVRKAALPLSQRWGVVSDLQSADFVVALQAAHGAA